MTVRLQSAEPSTNSEPTDDDAREPASHAEAGGKGETAALYWSGFQAFSQCGIHYRRMHGRVVGQGRTGVCEGTAQCSPSA